VTAVTLPARPVPWHKMAWVTWRQHRIALAGAAALLGAVALYLWLAGLRAHHAYAAVTVCRPAGSLTCGAIFSNFNDTYGPTSEAIAALLQVVPALVGAFAGAPVLARELETGTFRYTWTQGFGRWRWALAKLAPLAIILAAATGLFSLLFSWYFQPFFADGNQIPFNPTVFDLRGVAFAAWTLAAFAIGALAGMLIRRVVPAIAATLAVYAALALAAALYLRQHYLTPLVTGNVNPPGTAWIVSQWWTKGGRFVFAEWRDAPPALVQRLCPLPAGTFGKVSPVSIAQCLSQHGYTQWTSYQPASRFWPFQCIEGGWLLALSLLLIAASVWLVRHRAVRHRAV
jgi:hypothetical protein